RQLRVKLAGDRGPAFERGNERNAVRCPSRYPSVWTLAQPVGVGEGRDAARHTPCSRLSRDAVPAEMRNPYVRGQPATGPPDDAEPSHARRLLARFAQHLHAETHAEQRRSAESDIANDGIET